MSQIVKAFLGVFLTLFMAVVALSVLTAYMEVMNAQDMQARIVDELENSDYNAGVAKECFEKSKAAGYELAVTYFCEDAAVATAHSASEVPALTKKVDMAKVEMHFPFKVPFLGIEKTHTFVSYAR